MLQGNFGFTRVKNTMVQSNLPKLSELKIVVIGLGYVGLPLAVEFGKKRRVIGFDIDPRRVDELRRGHDRTLEVSAEDFKQAIYLTVTSSLEELSGANCFIVTVPTPIDHTKKPDLSMLLSACKLVGSSIAEGGIVIFESTVYPGATEEDCVPVIEEVSGLKFNETFFCGYSPERINPGDKTHRLTDIVKVVSGSTEQVTKLIDALYSEIISAGTHRAESIKVAEAAKVIENTQRDLNIALINELSIIFNMMGIDTEAVLSAASTKWNFLPFRPGLVGGHCIGVDPYYLTHKAQIIGYTPNVILAGREVNDRMGGYVCSQLLAAMSMKGIVTTAAKILVLGFTFKENCPDIRNTRVVDVVEGLKADGCDVDVYDPWVSNEEAVAEYGVCLKQELVNHTYDAVVICVAHDDFVAMGEEALRDLCKPTHVIYDVKHIFPAERSDLRL